MISKDRLLLQQQVYNFLRSVTIKYDPIAQYLNNTVIEKGYHVNEQDPTTWKYYLNMQGKYHISDTPMHVMSLDTRVEILFSAETLGDHPRTRNAYIPGGVYYNRLCEIYPEQVDLIKSIVFPVTDITKAIMASDLTLLGYSSGYLEEYEEKMIIMEIETFLNVLKERWYFDFLDDEPYFHLTFWGSLWTMLAMLIMSARLSYIRTPYVHSWHLWNELKGKGLDDYSDILNRKKSMMLYQNIDYLKANAGKQMNLVLLANRLLHDFGISIYGRKVVQESESNADKYQLVPQLQAVRVPLDTGVVTTEIASATVETIHSQVYTKGLTPENTSEAASAVERRLGDTTLNDFMTKFLEIRPITKNKVYSDTLNMFLLETLVTSITQGHYNRPLRINDLSLGTTFYLYPRELLALYHYAVQKSLGITPVDIPNKASLYKAFNPTIGTPVKSFQYGDELIYISSHVNATKYLTGLSYNEHITEPLEFSEMLSDLWIRYMDHLVTDQKTKIDKKHVILQYLSSLCHTRRVETIELVPNYTTYEQWFGPEGIDVASSVLSQYDIQISPGESWGNLADTIMSTLVPMTEILSSFGNFTLSDFGYTRLRQLFVQMCSYRVVFLESSRDTPEYALGAKWSTQYNAIDMETFANNTILHQMKVTSHLNSERDMYLHPGWVEHCKSEISTNVSYSVTTETNMGALAVEQHGELIRFTASSPGSNASQGTINLLYNRTTIGGIIVDTDGAYLTDDDNARIIDNDGSFIVDSPDE